MRWTGIIVVALFLVILCAILKRSFLPPRCPACGRRGLDTVREIPENRLSYHHCSGCNTRLKRHCGKWFIPSDQDWEASAMKGGSEAGR